jgi:hypothetical protein
VGNDRVKVLWTNSTGAVLYNVQQSTSSGSGYASVGTATGSPYTDTTVQNSIAYYYVVKAASDAAGNCASANSAEVSAISCVIPSRNNGLAEIKPFNTSNAYCVVTCDDIGVWQVWNIWSRRLYVNGVDLTGQVGLNLSASLLPAKVNGGYAFHYTSNTSGETDTGMNWWNGSAQICP